MSELVLDEAVKNWFLHENLMDLVKYLKHLIIVAVFVISND